MSLTAPRVQGPVNELCTKVQVLGVVPGAEVTLLLFDDETPESMNVSIGQEIAGNASVTFNLQSGQLIAEKYLAAMQSSATDGSSGPSRIREKIAPIPDMNEGLSPVVFLSVAYTCADWVLLGGLIPGAVIEISYQGAVVAKAVADRPVEPLSLHIDQMLAIGETLVAVQQLATAEGVMKSDPVSSLPIEQRYVENNRKLPVPLVDSPIECDEAVLVSGISDGASVFVKIEDNDYTYGFYGNSFWALTPQPVPYPGKVTVKQGTRNCGDYTLSDPVEATVLPGNLPAPKPIGPVCGNASTLRVAGLRPGAIVFIQFGQIYNDGREDWLPDPMKGSAWSTDCEFFLPEGWWFQPLPDGQNVFKVYQQSCSHTSPEAIIAIQDLPAPATPPVISPLVECSSIAHLTNVLAGSLITLWSDASVPDGEQISAPQRISDTTGFIHTYRPLHYKENIHAVQNGCGNSRIESAPVMVEKLAALPAPVIQVPIRLPHRGIYLKNLVAGARVNVYVNDNYALSRDIYTPSTFIAIASLKLGNRVKVMQTMCTGKSPFSQSGHAIVVLGEMKLNQNPSSIEKNKAASITIEAYDSDNGAKVAGDVWIGNSIVGQTFTPFAYTFTKGQPVPASKVSATDYSDQVLTWNLTDPPVNTAKLTLNLNNNTGYKITKVQWAIRKPNLANPLDSPRINTLSGSQVFTVLPKPDAANPSVYIIECLASIQVSSNTVYDFPMRTPINFGGRNDWYQLSWSGNDIIAQFMLVIEPVYDSRGWEIDITGHVQPQ